MISFIFFNTNELKNALDYLEQLNRSFNSNLLPLGSNEQINKTIELKNDQKIEESIKILNLAIECIGEYQEFIISLSSENQTQNN
jgi:hypothetical protein